MQWMKVQKEILSPARDSCASSKREASRSASATDTESASFACIVHALVATWDLRLINYNEDVTIGSRVDNS